MYVLVFHYLFTGLLLGAYLIETCRSEAPSVFTAILVFFISTMTIGEIMIHATNYGRGLKQIQRTQKPFSRPKKNPHDINIISKITGRAINASSNLLNIIDRIPKIDNGSTSGLTPSLRTQGNLSFKDVKFRYASRPKVGFS